MLGSTSIIHDGAQHCISITDPRQDTAEITLPAMCEHRTLLLRGTVHEAHHPSEYDKKFSEIQIDFRVQNIRRCVNNRKKLNLAEAKTHLGVGCLAC